MKYFISKDEMRLMAYLHENATAYSDDCMFPVATITEDTGLEGVALDRAGTFLRDFGLVGLIMSETYQSSGVMAVWLTGLGENMMRELESQPGLPSRITKKIIEEGWDTMKQIVVQVAGGYMAGGGR